MPKFDSCVICEGIERDEPLTIVSTISSSGRLKRVCSGCIKELSENLKDTESK